MDCANDMLFEYLLQNGVLPNKNGHVVNFSLTNESIMLEWDVRILEDMELWKKGR